MIMIKKRALILFLIVSNSCFNMFIVASMPADENVGRKAIFSLRATFRQMQEYISDDQSAINNRMVLSGGLQRCQENVSCLQREVYRMKEAYPKCSPSCLGAIYAMLGKAKEPLERAQKVLGLDGVSLEDACRARSDVFQARRKLEALCTIFAEKDGISEAYDSVTFPSILLSLNVSEYTCTIPADSLLLLLDRLPTVVPFKPCASCVGCPDTCWCANCCALKKEHESKNNSCINNLSKLRDEIMRYVSVASGDRYLALRIGALSRLIDKQVKKECTQQEMLITSEEDLEALFNDILEDRHEDAHESQIEDSFVQQRVQLNTWSQRLDSMYDALAGLPDKPAHKVAQILMARPEQVAFAEGCQTAEQEGRWFVRPLASLINRVLIGEENRQALHAARSELPKDVTLADVVGMVHGFIDEHGLQAQKPFMQAMLLKYGDAIDTVIEKLTRSVDASSFLVGSLVDGRSSRERYLGEKVSDDLKELGLLWHGQVLFLKLSAYQVLRQALPKSPSSPRYQLSVVDKTPSTDSLRYMHRSYSEDELPGGIAEVIDSDSDEDVERA